MAGWRLTDACGHHTLFPSLSIDKGVDLKNLKVTLLGLAATALAVAAAGCGGSSSNASGATGGGKVNLVAYSTPEPVYAKLIPAFQNTPAGKGSSFTQSYGSSGDQSRAVAAGQAADVVHFALAPD